tara:strand:+ start:1979 stop:2788 length:810 start_codon:yes stop_codon:yes gene_type:complete
MIIHNFDPILIDLGFFQIRWYSLAYILGIIIGWVYAIKIIKLTTVNKYNFKQVSISNLDEIIIYLILGIILGGRLGYVIFYNLDYYIQNYLEIFKLWEGGMSFHGGLLGVILSIIIFSKKKEVNFFKLSDIIACVAPIGLFFGRIANFINAELYGKISTLPWAVIFPSTDTLPRHPSQIYEALLEGVALFLFINYLALKKNWLFKPGYISAFFLIFYSFFRIFCEIFREPDTHIGFLFSFVSLGSFLSLITLISGLILFWLIKKNEQNI